MSKINAALAILAILLAGFYGNLAAMFIAISAAVGWIRVVELENK